MQVITIESEAFNKMMEEISSIKETLKESGKVKPLSEIWLDNQDVCDQLHISKRTLQHYRDSGAIKFSQINAKIYYKASDIQAFLESHYNG